MSNMPIALMEDSPPYIDYRNDVKENRAETIKAGRIMYDNVVIVSLTPMGDNKTIVEKEVGDWLAHLGERLHNKQISQKYYDFCTQHYAAWSEKRELPAQGTPLQTWPQIDKAQIENVLNANIRTVEDLANANDEGLQLIGMGGRALKEKAKTYLKSATDHGAVTEKVSSLESQLQTAQDDKKIMEDRLHELEMKIAANPPVEA